MSTNSYQWFPGGKAETDILLRSVKGPQTAAHWIEPEPYLGSVCHGADMVGLKTPWCAYADII